MLRPTDAFRDGVNVKYNHTKYRGFFVVAMKFCYIGSSWNNGAVGIGRLTLYKLNVDTLLSQQKYIHISTCKLVKGVYLKY